MNNNQNNEEELVPIPQVKDLREDYIEEIPDSLLIHNRPSKRGSNSNKLGGIFPKYDPSSVESEEKIINENIISHEGSLLNRKRLKFLKQESNPHGVDFHWNEHN